LKETNGMPIADVQARVSLSVLDRLIDLDPGSRAEPPGNRLGNIRDLKEAVWRDLSTLLNSRRRTSPVAEEFKECNRSLLVFGLADFTPLSLRSPEDQQKLRRAIATAIATFEPRLSEVSVALEQRTELDPVLRYRVEAVLNIEPAPEPISFDTVLHADTGQFQVVNR
jgi:type VI secretion system protein ImpF